MSIKIINSAGAEVWDDDLAVEIEMAQHADRPVGLLAVLNHLELVAAAPSMAGDSTSFAARVAVKLIREFAEAGDIDLELAEVPA